MTELMLLLVFMAIAFSFLAKTEGKLTVDRRDIRIQELTAENTALKRDLQKTKAELVKLQRFLDRIGVDGVTLKPKGGTIRIGDVDFVSTAGHAPGAPLCKLPNKYLFAVALLDGGMVEIAAPPSLQDPKLATFATLNALRRTGRMGIDDFKRASAEFNEAWSGSGEKCRFAVQALRRTNNADVFDAELHAVERFFYVTRS